MAGKMPASPTARMAVLLRFLTARAFEIDYLSALFFLAALRCQTSKHI